MGNYPSDPEFLRWFEALEQRHLVSLSFQEVRKGVQALSSLYVERRNRIGTGAALDGAGKRAAFAYYFAPLHFLLVREIVRSLNAASRTVPAILDLGCGTGSAGAAWALEMNPRPKVFGVERNSWAIREAKWNYRALGIQASISPLDIDSLRFPRKTAIVAAFTVNELSDESRDRLLGELRKAAREGAPVLIVEPIARRLAKWWPDWVEQWKTIGGQENEWRLRVELPEQLALMDKAAGLDHRELTGRSLWYSGGLL